jgi:uncharacterized membrane protein
MKISLSKVSGLIFIISIIAYSCKKEEEVSPEAETVIEEVVTESTDNSVNDTTNNVSPIDTSLIALIDTTVINQVIDSLDIANISTDTLTKVTVSYAQTIAPIISTNCNGSNCHGTTATNKDIYVTYEGLKTIAGIDGKLKERVVTKQTMPLGKTLTETQIANIDDWILQGALDN